VSDDDLSTEAELAHTRARVRAHVRQQWIAKGAAVAITLVGLVLGLIATFVMPDIFIRRYILWAGLFAGGALGSFAWRRLEPQGEIDDV
jgi:hypothetical protein